MEELEYVVGKRRARARENQRKRNQRPDVKAKRAAYAKEYTSRPEVKARLKDYNREYNQRPDIKERHREYQREYTKRPEVKARRNESNRNKTIAKMIEKIKAAGYTVIKEEEQA